MTETEEMGMSRCNGSVGGGSTGRGSAGSAIVYRSSAGGDSNISMDSSLAPVSPRLGSSGRGSSGSVDKISPTPKALRSRRISAESVEQIPLVPVVWNPEHDVEKGADEDGIPMMDAYSNEIVSAISVEEESKNDQSQKHLLTVPNGDLVSQTVSNDSSLSQSDILNINVGGRRARLSAKLLLSKIPEAKLGVFASKDANGRLSEADAFFEPLQEYYFERSPIIFEYIVDFYVTGKLHRPMDVCPIRLRYEMEYWRIPLTLMSACCQLEENNNVRTKVDKMGARDQSTPEFEKVWLGHCRRQIYLLLENPRSSSYAKILSFVSAGFVLLSLTGLILSSMPEFQLDRISKEPVNFLNWLELSCMIYFTFEYIVRFMVHPKKCHFMCSPLNVIDLLTIIPFLVEAFNEMPLMKNFRGAMLVVRVMRLARVARIFKLARYSTGLRAFGETMKKSAAELSMLGMFLVTGIMLFSTAIYFFERDEPNSKFYSIPAACWWCVITMTTVGYGDLVPVTAGGKFVAALASVCGIIVLAFPISMIIDKFAESTTANWQPQDDENVGSARRKQTKRYLF